MQALDDRTFRGFADLMYRTAGLCFADNKKSLVASRLGTRIQRLGLDDYRAYLALLSRDAGGGELQVALNLLTTNETYFFREPAHYELLERELNAQQPQRLRLWSAAASFGDEAYSTAMLLADLEKRGRIGGDWSILGTDISERVLEAASQAIFPEERLRDLSLERRKRYCLRGEGASAGLVQIVPQLRSRVRFGWLNLCRPIEELGPFDVIFLRNVLIYFDAPTKVEVVDRVLTQLRPGGLFFMGTAEGRVPCRTPLQTISAGAFRKAGG